ncbi:hypothetical protein CFC21_021076 [Triticum aestivum]|uniref:KIB1-4 beta-propeller domain-containing protein n=2 Tax=Triticum aestivum TaxID=4565 RepID=A0A3B6BY88_WHEAT|nr:hypothetical protein CFC21_021076 [Triticum aestivum]
MGLVEKPPVAAAASTMEPEVNIPGDDARGHESIIPMTDEANWDDLPHDLVRKVAEILLRCDVTDFVRLRTVKPWRDAVTAPNLMGMNPRFFPRHWRMLVQGQGEHARFVNVLTGAFIRVKIPRHYGQVLACTEGCLLFASPSGWVTQKLRLCNPVTRAVASLPNLHTTLISQDLKAAGIIYDIDGGAPTPTVVLLVAASSADMVLYAKPGDSMWQWQFFFAQDEGDGAELPLLDGDGSLSLGGSFYVPTRSGDVLKLELQPQPHFVYAATQQEATGQVSHLHLNLRSYLVPSVDAGMLLVVRRFESHAGYLAVCNAVFQVNLTEGTLTRLQDHKDISSRSIFLRSLTLGTH